LENLTVAGTVKWFDATKGYGFILPEDGGPEEKSTGERPLLDYPDNPSDQSRVRHHSRLQSRCFEAPSTRRDPQTADFWLTNGMFLNGRCCKCVKYYSHFNALSPVFQF
jgi:hypothetical protein